MIDSDDEDSEPLNVTEGTSILTLDKLSLDNVYLNYLQHKTKQLEEEGNNPPDEESKNIKKKYT